MILQKEILGIIPARGGSKGIPGKNIKLLNGKPLIAYTIEEAIKCDCIQKLIVSTDSSEIAAEAKQFGAEVPFIRPNNLATDTASSIEVVLHAVNWLKEKECYIPDIVLILQPTSPLRTASDIKNVLIEMINTNADSLASVCEAAAHPFWMKKIEHGKLLPFFETPNSYTRRQDLPEVYQLNGAIYAVKTNVLVEKKSIYGDDTRAYIMPAERSIDIDNMLDWRLAEILLKERIVCD